MEEWPEGFDLAALLTPISAEAPAGSDLRQDYSPDSFYYRLRDARSEARAAERAIDNGNTDAAALPRWRAVRDLAIEALSERSKDIEIATWLTEALLRDDGLVGLAAGGRLLAGLAETYWDGFFPQPDEEGLDGRLAPVAGLTGVGGEGTMLQPLRRTLLFSRPDGTPFEFWDYLRSAETAAIGDAERRQQRIDSGVLPFETVENEARAAGVAQFARLHDRAAEAAAAWQALGQILDQRAGAEAPSTSQVRDVLQQIEDIAERFAPPQAGAPEAVAGAPSAEVVGADRPAMAAAPRADGLTSREDALRALAQIAEFFRRAEPLSPITYTLQEAVRRSRLTWPELLEEIVPDSTSRSAILSSLGIRPPPNE
jgi:type VI secretion system protein ImpA